MFVRVFWIKTKLWVFACLVFYKGIFLNCNTGLPWSMSNAAQCRSKSWHCYLPSSPIFSELKDIRFPETLCFIPYKCSRFFLSSPCMAVYRRRIISFITQLQADFTVVTEFFCAPGCGREKLALNEQFSLTRLRSDFLCFPQYVS